MNRQREIVQSPLVQGEDEEIYYGLDTSEWGEGPTNVGVVVKDPAGTDVSTTMLTGSPIVAGSTLIILPLVHDLDAGIEYRVEIQFTIGTTVFECYGYIRAEV